jgi:sugar/nucleoside kinase (ribokinase family)
MKDICCIGHITRDKIITPSQSFSMSGGTAFYMAYGINNLPHDIAFQLVTKVGPESYEEVDRMRQAGIDVVCYDSAKSVYFENRYGIDSNQRTQRVLAKADPFTIEEVLPLEAKVFHLGSLLADDFPVEVVKALAKKGRISIDVQGYLREVRGEKVYAIKWKAMEEILAYIDILKLNEHEMEMITNSKDPRTVALQMASYGVREVVITLGSFGSLIYADKQFYEIPAYEPRQVVDATGCGDTYSAGYLYMRSLGADIDASGKFAAAMCTSKLEHNGPYDGK